MTGNRLLERCRHPRRTAAAVRRRARFLPARAAAVLRENDPRAPAVLFRCDGIDDAGAPVGLGTGLAAVNPVFAASIDAGAATVRRLTGIDPAALLEPRTTPRTAFADALLRLAVQVAYVDAWRHAGVVADAALGASLGEPVAAYAVGALSRDDALAAGCVVAQALGQAPPARAFRLPVGSAEAKRACRVAPRPAAFTASCGPAGSWVTCAVADAPAIRAHLERTTSLLDEADAGGSAGTPGPWSPDAVRERLATLDWRPPRRPLFLAGIGGALAADVPLEPDYWRWIGRHPAYCDEAALAATRAGYVVVLGLEARPDRPRALRSGGGPLHGSGIRRPGRPEAEAFDAARTALRASGVGVRRRRPLRAATPPVAPAPTRGPVRRTPEGYLLTGHDAVRRGLSQAGTYSSCAWQALDVSLLGVDPPEHSRLRAALRPAFAPDTVAAVAARCDVAAEEVLTSLAGRDEFDVVADFAGPVVERVLAHLLGINAAQVTRFAATACGAESEPDLALVDGALAALPDPPALMVALADEHGLDRAEARSLVRFLWVAGNVTTRRFITSAVEELGARHDVRTALLANRELIPPFLEEVLRLHPPEDQLLRAVLRTDVVGGVVLGPGDVVRLSVAEANRDPARFPDAEALRPERENRHLSFGAGHHRCIGARLARAEGHAAIAALLRLMPRFEVVQPVMARRDVGHWAVPVLEDLFVSPGAPLSR